MSKQDQDNAFAKFRAEHDARIKRMTPIQRAQEKAALVALALLKAARETKLPIARIADVAVLMLDELAISSADQMLHAIMKDFSESTTRDNTAADDLYMLMTLMEESVDVLSADAKIKRAHVRNTLTALMVDAGFAEPKK